MYPGPEVHINKKCLQFVVGFCGDFYTFLEMKSINWH